MTVWVKSSVENSQPVKHDLDLIVSPPPQDVEQVDQSLHDDSVKPLWNITQAVTNGTLYNLQSPSLQISVWIRSLEVAREHVPPMQVLILVFSPFPQVALQSEYDPHAEYTKIFLIFWQWQNATCIIG